MSLRIAYSVGRLFYHSERIYATAYGGGSSDPGVCVELKFGNFSEVHIMELLDRKVAPGDTEQLTMSEIRKRYGGGEPRADKNMSNMYEFLRELDSNLH